MVEIQGLTRKFGNFVAVNNLNLQVPRGTIFGFLGPNGAGKSTTVKVLTGILTPSAGDAVIDGLSIRTSPTELKRRIGVLPEDLALFELLTIWEHLEMCGAIHGLSHRETATRGEQLLTYLDLWKDRHAFVDHSSHGMKKKCAIAMALIHNPKVLFLDEPFEGIDPVSSRNIKDLLVLMAGKGVTVFITSHILEIVERLVHSFAIIVNGEIACSQTMEETVSAGHSLEDIYFRYVERRTVEGFEWIG